MTTANTTGGGGGSDERKTDDGDIGDFDYLGNVDLDDVPKLLDGDFDPFMVIEAQKTERESAQKVRDERGQLRGRLAEWEEEGQQRRGEPPCKFRAKK